MTSYEKLNHDRSWVDGATILRCEVGSGAHGIAKEGRDDRDEMGICLEPFALAWSTEGQFDQHIYRTATERTGKQDAPSQPGDLDLTIYSLRKWARLALAGNPTVLIPLFGPLVASNAHGAVLREMAPMFASKLAISRFLGYLGAQRQRLLGERGQKNVNRRDLVEKFGFDTKYAGHMIRLGFQGVEYGQTGKLTLPMEPVSRQYVRDVREGLVPLNDVLTKCGELEQELADLKDTSPLPDQPDIQGVNAWMRHTYLKWWQADASFHPARVESYL